MRADRLAKLADYLEINVEDSWFDMRIWASHGFPEHECGSVGCAIGFYCTAFPDDGLFLRSDTSDDGYICYYPMYDTLDGFSAIATCFDIPEDHAIDLFDPESYENFGVPASRAFVIKRIRDYIKWRNNAH